MYLLICDDEPRLASLADDLDELDELEHLDLGEMNSLALHELVGDAAVDWMAGEPIVFVEESGLVIGRFALAGVNWLAECDELDEFGIDPGVLAQFVPKCDEGNVYFLDTF